MGRCRLKRLRLGSRLSREISSVGYMTQDALLLKKYHEERDFIETNHRNPSRYDPEGRGMYCNWIKHNKKLLKAGEMNDDRVALFEKLLELGEKYRRVNQYE